MLQQTQVKTVLPYWERWMRELPDIAALARAKLEKLHKLWEGLGYYARVRNLQKAARLVVNKHDGRFPVDFEQVLELPGIGRYTAGAICSIAFNQPKPLLDGNVMRVLSRLYGIAGNLRERKTNARLWQLAEDLVACAARTRARRACSRFNQSLMELGALICTPRQPRCGVCPVAKQCVAYRQDRVDQLPELSRRSRATRRRFVAFVAQRDGLFLVRQRPAGVVNAHLWEFPNVELDPGGRASPRALISGKVWARGDARLPKHAVLTRALGSAARRALGLSPSELQPLCVVKHSITRYRITLEVYQVTVHDAARIEPAMGRWLGPRRLNQLAFTSAHKQILKRLEDE